MYSYSPPSRNHACPQPPRLPAEQGALLLKAMELAVDTAEAPGDEPGEVTAETPLEKKACIAARRADALAEMAEVYLADEAPTGATADRYQVVVHVTAETSHAQDLDLPRLEPGPAVTAETSRRIGCDCAIVPVFKGIRGEPLSVGRKTRAIPPAVTRYRRPSR